MGYGPLLEAYTVFLIAIWAVLIAISLPRRRKIYTPHSRFRGKVLVVMPCKGKDLFFERGIRSVLRQAHSGFKFDFIAVADSASDPSVRALRRLKVHYILREPVCTRCSNKVMAISTAIEQFPDYAAYVIVDSDTYCLAGWLESLVQPLADKGVGISTTFPDFISVKGSGLWAKVKMVWGYVGSGMMESERTRFAWGGSMAFRNEIIRNGMHAFKRAVSDDIALTKIAREKGLKIHYAGGALVEVPSRDDFSTFMEWSNRQAAFSVHGYRANLYLGIPFYFISILLFVSGIVLAFLNPVYLFLLLPFFIRLAKVYRRARSANPLIIPIFMVIDAVYLCNLIIGASKKEVVWRGVRYRLD